MSDHPSLGGHWLRSGVASSGRGGLGTKDGSGCGALGMGVTVHGHLDLAPDVVRRALAAGDFRGLAAAPGHFVLIAEQGANDAIIVCGRSGIVSYHYAAPPGCMPAHGSNVADVARRAGLEWSWDHSAVADYLAVGHPLDDRTPHMNVRRMPAGSIVKLRGGTVTVSCLGLEDVGPPPRRGSLGTAIEALVEAARALPSDSCWLSMSGGLDSRLLLAALLAAGRRPRLIVSGASGSFDRDVSTAIAAAMGLPLAAVVVDTAAVAVSAPTAAEGSSGLLPVSHWAGLVHLVHPSGPTLGPVVLGSNGEFARSYYAPQFALGDIRLALARPEAALELLAKRSALPFTEEELTFLHPTLREQLHPEAVRERLRAALVVPNSCTALAAADEFFLRQHGRRKTAADLSALSATGVDWRVPLFNIEWVEAVRALPRRWKLGSAFHRYAVARLQPKLLRFPEEFGGAVTSRVPGLRYLLGPRHQPRGAHYLEQSMFRSPALLHLLRQGRTTLGGLVDPVFVDRLADEQARIGHRPHLIFTLMALALAARRPERDGERKRMHPADAKG